MSPGEIKFAAFDIESTGPDPKSDRIVTANVTYADVVDGELKIGSQVNWLLDPGIEISEGASAIHGVTTEKARAEGGDYAQGLRDIISTINASTMEGDVLVAYNAAFDLTMLHHEAKRVFPSEQLVIPYRRVLDPFVIDKSFDKYRKGKRTLTATAAHYGISLENAHTADADAEAALKLAWVLLKDPRLANRFPDGVMKPQEVAYRQQAEGLAEYWRKKASQMQLDDPEGAAELRERADGIGTEWPVAR